MTHSFSTVCITGATSGIGEACARLLAPRAERLILIGRTDSKLSQLVGELRTECLTMALDVRRREEVLMAFARLPDAFRSIDVLVNNAGLALGLEPAQSCDMDDWQQMVDTNIGGVMYCTHAVLPGMVARRKGHIVNLGSVAGTWPYPGGNVYGATKAFLHQFSLGLRADLLGSPVRVTNIEPGMVETAFSAVRFKGDNEKARSVYAGTHPLTAHDIAETIVWCLERPAHVNINTIELMPVDQAFSPLAVHRQA